MQKYKIVKKEPNEMLMAYTLLGGISFRVYHDYYDIDEKLVISIEKLSSVGVETG